MNYKESQNIRYVSNRTMHVKLKFERILDTVIGSLIHSTPYVYSSDILLEIAVRQWMWIGGLPRLVTKQFVIYLNTQRLNITSRWLDTVHCEIMAFSVKNHKEICHWFSQKKLGVKERTIKRFEICRTWSSGLLRNVVKNNCSKPPPPQENSAVYFETFGYIKLQAVSRRRACS
jgi:hypothetical protein